MKKLITQEECMFIGEHRLFDGMTDEMAVGFQLMQPTLFFPTFESFHDKVERVLQRPVYTHEFAAPLRLAEEFTRKTGIKLDTSLIPAETKEEREIIDSLNKVVDSMIGYRR